MARGLALLLGAGGTLVLLTLALPHGGGAETLPLVLVALSALVVAGGLLASDGRLAPAALGRVLDLGALLVALCVLLGGASASAYPLMFVWVALYAAYFFSPAKALAHGAVAAAAYALVLVAGDDVAVPAVHWVMAAGTLLVGGLLISQLTQAVRAQAADLSTVAQMAGRLGAVGEVATATCDGLRASVDADVVVLLTALPGDEGLEVTAMSGTPEAGLLLSSEAARDALERGFRAGEAQTIRTGAAPSRWPWGPGTLAGAVQPVLRDGRPTGLLAAGWTTPRRALGERAEQAMRLFAAEAGVVLERAEQLSREKERRALEINDNIVQGLVVAKMAARGGQVDAAVRAIDETLAAARRLITEQLEDVAGGGELVAGDLVRASATSLS